MRAADEIHDNGQEADRGRPPRTLVLIPAYNEAGRIEAVIDGLQRLPGQRDILVVDDGSGDATAKRARDLGATVLSHPFNLGYGAALHRRESRRRC